MGRIFIKCPECGQQLSFEEVPGYRDMLVECPKCHFKATTGVYMMNHAAPSPKNSVKNAANKEETTKLYMPKDTACDFGHIRLKDSGKIYRLKEGTNIIGRNSKTSLADIRIDGDDYMSRRHARIDVIKNKNFIEHRLIEINSKNIILLNGKPINRGDILVIKFGDVLTLGKTEIVLESIDETSLYM